MDLVQIDSVLKKKLTDLHCLGRVPGNAVAFPFLLDDKGCNLHGMFLLVLFGTYPLAPLSLVKTMTHFYHLGYAEDLEILLAWAEDTGNSKQDRDALRQAAAQCYSYYSKRSPTNHFLNDGHLIPDP